MSLTGRLIRYQKNNKLTDEALFLELRASGILVSSASVKNWVKNKNEPSRMFRASIENFLAKEDKIERTSEQETE